MTGPFRWAAGLNGLGVVTAEDLEQCAFLALEDALEAWNPERGLFLTLYGLRLKAAFSVAAGVRTQRAKRDPLQTALSLDSPLTDDAGDPFALADTVPDPAAEAAVEAVAELDFRRRRHEARKAVVSRWMFPSPVNEDIGNCRQAFCSKHSEQRL